ncbi:Tat pathway signal sequence domain protein [Streptomyces sp. RSD-27]|nr:Tat pathway signal sequence domain protein [Streptomyces sp. RSD-27]
MAEIIQKDGTWTFDGDAVRIVPGRDKGVGLLRQQLGEVVVPLRAIGGISYEPGRKSGRLRLRVRDGADPLLQVTGGRLPEQSDPYRLAVEPDRTGVAEYFVDEVRHALLLDGVDPGPSDAYLLPGPAVPISVAAGGGSAAFDGDRVVLDWNWTTEEAKASGGPRAFRVGDVRAVEWAPSKGLENGWLRFTLAGAPPAPAPKYDPCTVELFGFKKDPLMALVAAAVAVRMPHPAAPAPAPAAPAALPLAESAPALAGEPADHDTLLRRLRELGELHQSGVLTADEFSAAKAAILGGF